MDSLKITAKLGLITSSIFKIKYQYISGEQ